MSIQSATAALQERLRILQFEGLWGFQTGQFLEPACLALLALRGQPVGELRTNLRHLIDLQDDAGGWPAFVGDKEGSWVTALVVLSLLNFVPQSEVLKKAATWLLTSKGREAHWLWRWKFRMMDTSVQFDPAYYGWSWVPGTISWVIPTAFAILALQKMLRAGVVSEEEVRPRVETGMNMLLDRTCPSGGWNAGNRAAFGVEYAPYLDTTAVALLALKERTAMLEVQKSLAWLGASLPQCPSVYSLAWGVLAIDTHRDPGGQSSAALLTTIRSLVARTDEIAASNDVTTVALAVLALNAADGNNTLKVPA